MCICVNFCGFICLFLCLGDDELLAWDLQRTRQETHDIELTDGNWRDVVAVNDRLYVIDNTTEYLRAWDYGGNRQAGDDIALGSGNWIGVAATDTEIWILNRTGSSISKYVLATSSFGTALQLANLPTRVDFSGMTITNNRIWVVDEQFVGGTQYVRAWDHTGARQASDDITLGTFGIYVGAGASPTRIYVIDAGSPQRMRAFTHAGREVGSEEIRLGSLNITGVGFLPSGATPEPPAPTPDHDYSITAGARDAFIGYWDNNIGTITDENFSPLGIGSREIRQSMWTGSAFRWLIRGSSRPASNYPDRIIATSGANTVTFEQPDPPTRTNYGQGTGMDYVVQSGTATDVFVNGATINIGLHYD